MVWAAGLKPCITESIIDGVKLAVKPPARPAKEQGDTRLKDDGHRHRTLKLKPA